MRTLLLRSFLWLGLASISLRQSHAFAPAVSPKSSSSSSFLVQKKLVAATPHSQWLGRSSRFIESTSTALRSNNPAESTNDDNDEKEDSFKLGTTLALVGGQSALIGLAVAAAAILHTPQWGLGPNTVFSLESIGWGALMSAPLGIFAAVLDLVEDRFPALQDVTNATHRSVLALMGSQFKPLLGLAVATALGLAAGFGEEMMFRGVLQFELAQRIGTGPAVAIASVIFGALHAVTPLYAGLATIASVYFGFLYLAFDLNLVVPIAAHAVYDVVALFYAHHTVCALSPQEQAAVVNWEGPGTTTQQ